MPLFGPPNVEKLKAQRDVKGLIKVLIDRKECGTRYLKVTVIFEMTVT
jgi:hypothetical protein